MLLRPNKAKAVRFHEGLPALLPRELPRPSPIPPGQNKAVDCQKRRGGGKKGHRETDRGGPSELKRFYFVERIGRIGHPLDGGGVWNGCYLQRS